MFSSSGLLPTVVAGLRGRPRLKKLGKGGIQIGRKKKSTQKLTECIGTAMNLGLRHYYETEHFPVSPYGYACSLRCKHPMHIKDRSSNSRGKSEDFIPEHLYRKYTETDSRPLTPDPTRRSVSLPRGKSVSEERRRRCVTPEPEARQCQFHHRRVLVLDLRRVKSVDGIGRQGSRTPGTSVDSTGDDADASSSMLFQFSPRPSVSRSITPKTKQRFGKKKIKERSSSPIIYERSSSPKILEGLTLPPLHSSVLTLLGGGGQRSTRGIGGSGLQSQHPQETTFSTSLIKHKKLRRHGRASRKTEKDDENPRQAENSRAGSEEVKKLEDPNETQISTIVEHEEEDRFFNQALPNRQTEESLEVDLKQNLKNFKQSRQALYSVLDDYLVGKVWSTQELSTLDEQIQGISQEFQKLETKFQTQNIQLMEGTWLGFPRTWSRSSATFSAPSDAKSLKDMHPLDYLKQFVSVSGPRKHLYSLVFQRYRTMENPTKDWIWIKTLQPALSEILGRQFRQEEMLQLCHHYLGEDEPEKTQIYESIFIGICAFSERIYGDYSLEENDECHKCYKNPNSNNNNNKQECHRNKKNHLEKADFSYLFSKVRDGQVQKHLGNLFLALCNKD